VPSKVIAAKDYRVDKKGDIVGKGHAKRDVVEWLIPPLWPWKVLMLPARGPRPTLKGESQITVRLMDDIEVPHTGAAYRSYEKPASYDHPPAYYHPQSFGQPSAPKQPVDANATYEATNAEATESSTATAAVAKPARLKMIALKSEDVYAVTKYRISGGVVSYVLASGETGSVAASVVDWRATSRLNAGPIDSTVAGNFQRAAN
jgi:hypothetical protein